MINRLIIMPLCNVHIAMVNRYYDEVGLTLADFDTNINDATGEITIALIFFGTPKQEELLKPVHSLQSYIVQEFQMGLTGGGIIIDQLTTTIDVSQKKVIFYLKTFLTAE